MKEPKNFSRAREYDMSTSRPGAIVVGVNESFDGNEDSIISAFPFIKCSGRKALAAVCELGWNCETGAGLSWLEADFDISDVGTALEDDDSHLIRISNNQIVTIIGPGFFKMITFLFGQEYLAQQLHGHIFSTKRGFLIACVTVETYKRACANMFNDALRLFDDEARASRNSVTEKATAALGVLDGVGLFASEEARYMRLAAASEMECNYDMRNEYLDYAAIDLDLSEEDVRKKFHNYLHDLGLVIGTYPTYYDYERTTDLPVPPPTPQFPALIPFLAESFVTSAARILLQKEISAATIDHLAVLATALFTDIQKFRPVWKNLALHLYRNGFPESNRNLMNFLRSFTVATTLLFESRGKPDWTRHGSSYQRALIVEKAQNLNTAAKRLRINELTFGQSQFHEDAMLGFLFLDVMESLRDGVIRARLEPLIYGLQQTTNNRVADLSIINELIHSNGDASTTERVFHHKGYYGFARREVLESLADDNVPEPVKMVIADTLLARDPKDLIKTPKDASTKDMEARFWIAMRGGLRPYNNSEYRTLFSKMYEIAAKKIGELPEPPDPHDSDEFDKDFEDFVTGRPVQKRSSHMQDNSVNVFMGGSIHARLLISWWIKMGIDEFVPVIYPGDIRSILGKWPENRVRLANHLTGESAEHIEFRKCVRELFLELACLLAHIVQNSRKRGSEESGKFLGYQMWQLVNAPEREERARWSFIPDQETFCEMLSDDDEFDCQGRKV